MRNGVKSKVKKPDMVRPGTDGQVWLEVSGCYGFPLNATGRDTVERFMAKYHGWPAACLKRKRSFHGSADDLDGGGLYARAVRVLGEDELHAVACGAVVRAATNYDPTAHGCSEGGYTYIVNGVYLTVQRAVQVECDRKERQSAVWGEQADDDLLVQAVGREPDPADEAELADGRAGGLGLLARCGAALTFREWQAVAAKYKLGLRFDHIGTLLGGVTCERARQVVNGAVRKMRAVANRHPSGDGKGTSTRLRSDPCPTRSARAASL